MNAIETEVDGYLMRSRLEARWAVFLNALGIAWEYEFEGFVLPNGVWYLPDFYLPTFNGGTFLEVKAVVLSSLEREKCWQLCIGSKKTVWLGVGVPSFRCYEVFYFANGDVVEGDGIPNADQAEHENRFFGMSAYGVSGGAINPEYRKLIGDTFINAVKAATQARFEHKNKS